MDLLLNVLESYKIEVNHFEPLRAKLNETKESFFLISYNELDNLYSINTVTEKNTWNHSRDTNTNSNGWYSFTFLEVVNFFEQKYK